MDQNNLYENFHKVTKPHNHLITVNDFTNGHLIKLFNKHIGSKKSVLDVGCGTGSLSLYLGSKNNKVVGIDISNKAIYSAKENAKKFNLTKKCTFLKTTLEDYENKNRFDAILMLEVIEHLEDDKSALLKINSLLKKQGLIILSTPSLSAPLYRVGFLNKFDIRVGHKRRYSKDSIKNLMKKANLKIVFFQEREGILRNFIYTSTLGGKVLLKIINRSNKIAKIVTTLDNLLIKIFGESDYLLVATK